MGSVYGQTPEEKAQEALFAAQAAKTKEQVAASKAAAGSPATSSPTRSSQPIIHRPSGGGGGGGGGGTARPAATSQPKLSAEEMAEQYALTSGMINAFPELKMLFDQAVREGWTPDKFQAKFRNTDWYKSRSEQQRKAAIMSYQDPASWSQLWNTTQNHVRDLMGDMGADPNNWEQINAAASQIIWNSWDDTRIRDFLGQYIVFGSGGLAGGKAGATQQELNSYAYSMGVQNADWWQQSAIRQIMTGQKTTQDFKNEILQQSIAAFPGLEKQLRAGQTLADVAQPYTQSMAQILEIPVGNINTFDPTIRNALSFKDPAGSSQTQPLWQFQNTLRQDPRWTKTQNAQDAAMGTAHQVLQQFGMVS